MSEDRAVLSHKGWDNLEKVLIFNNIEIIY